MLVFSGSTEIGEWLEGVVEYCNFFFPINFIPWHQNSMWQPVPTSQNLTLLIDFCCYGNS